MLRVFASGTGDQGSIPGQVIPKLLKLMPQHYEIWIKGKD